MLLLNGLVGFQLLDDGTPLSLGLILGSAVALFIGTGYIALDTAFRWTGHFNPSLEDPNRNIGLYVLYQLAPLVFLFGFFCLECFLVLRILGEKKPMRSSSQAGGPPSKANSDSVSLRGGSPIWHRPSVSVCRQCPHLQWDQRQDQWRPLRDPLHASVGGDDLDILVKYHRRRLACANIWGWYLHMTP